MEVLKQKAYFDQEAADFLFQDKIKARLDADTRTRVENGETQFADGSEYVRIQISGQSSTTDLIRNTTTQKKGEVSFDKAKLDDGEYLILKAIRIGFGSAPAAGGTDDPAQVYYSPLLRDDLPAAILGADLNIIQDGKTVFTLPVVDLLLDGVQQGTPKINAYKLDNWKLIEAGRPFKIQFDYAQGLSVPADPKWFAEIRLFGTSTVRR